MNIFLLTVLLAYSPASAEEPVHEAEQVFPPVETQSHRPGSSNVPTAT